ncbi:MAG: RsmE family RNA methyltransferase [bacterium]
MEFFFIPELERGKGQVVISGSEARHIVRVLRHKPGDEIFGTNGRGDEFKMAIKEIKPNRIVVEVLKSYPGGREPDHRVALAPAVLKGDKLAGVVEAVTELGVSEIIPFVSERVIGRVTERRLNRMRAVAISGMKNALRTVLPRIRPPLDFQALLKRFADFDQVVVAYEEQQGSALKQVLDAKAKSLLLVIGPEGGFSQEEARRMAAAGAALFSLGPRRLRAETAAVAGTALCLDWFGDLK